MSKIPVYSKEDNKATPDNQNFKNAQMKIISLEDSIDDFNLIEYYTTYHFPKSTIEHVFTYTELLELLKDKSFDILLLDLFLEGLVTIDFIPELQEKFSDLEIVIVSGQPDIRTVLKCIEYGTSYIVKGTMLETDLLRVLSEKVKIVQQKRENRFLKDNLFTPINFPLMIFKSSKNRREMIYKDFEIFPEPLRFSQEKLIKKIEEYTIVGKGSATSGLTGLSYLQLVFSSKFELLIFSYKIVKDHVNGKIKEVMYFHFTLFIPIFISKHLPSNHELSQVYEELFEEIINENREIYDFDKLKLKIVKYLRNNIVV